MCGTRSLCPEHRGARGLVLSTFLLCCVHSTGSQPRGEAHFIPISFMARWSVLCEVSLLHEATDVFCRNSVIMEVLEGRRADKPRDVGRPFTVTFSLGKY